MFGQRKELLDFGLEESFDLQKAFVGDGFALGSIGLDLGAVEADVSELQQSHLAAEAGLDPILSEEERVPELGKDPKAEEPADDLKKMGPIYVKLGQVFSSRGGLLPASYVKALARLQDHNQPFSYAEVVETIEKELGCRLSKAFQEFDAPSFRRHAGEIMQQRMLKSMSLGNLVTVPLPRRDRRPGRAPSRLCRSVLPFLEVGRRRARRGSGPDA